MKLWHVLLVAASFAAVERLTTGEASAIALWIIGVWAMLRVLLWAYPWRRVRRLARTAVEKLTAREVVRDPE